MSSTNEARVVVKVVAFLAISSFLYFMLVAGDYVIARYGVVSPNPQASLIESQRSIAEDVPQRAAAISEGFSPIFYPSFLEDTQPSPLRALAERYAVAPLAPQPNTAVYYCNEGYGLLKYTTDKYGFRNKASVWNKHADIVLIGDSFTHGACLEHDQTIVGALEATMNVVNLGTGGNGPIHYAALAKTFLPRIKPKYAVMIFYANDNQVFDDLEKSYHYKYYFVENRSYFLDGEKLQSNPDLARFYKEATTVMGLAINDKAEEVQPSFFERGPLLQRASKYLSLPNIRWLLGTFKFNQNRSELDLGSKLAIDSLVLECQRPACQPLVVYIPNSDFWRPDSRAKSFEDALAKRAANLRISFWSASQELSEIPNNAAYAIKGPHLSPIGNSIVAEGIKRFVGDD
jgi:hypothetical protein